MKILKLFGCILLAIIVLINCGNQKPHESKIRIAVQAWSFHKFTFEEAARKISEIGFKYIEMYPDQIISMCNDSTTHFTMSKGNRELVKSILNKNRLKLVQYGVVTCTSKAEWVQLFDFAKEMGIETIVAEPGFEDYKLLDSLTQDCNINLAVHNHATGTTYWNPQIVLDHIGNLNPRIGACADNGHWMRSGLNPIEALKKYQGRLITMHIKDINEFNNLDAHTVPLGTGVLDFKGLISELKRQNFSGVLTIENEYDWDNPINDLKVSFKNLSEKLSQ
jgi:sugar phosphate isomerase/epimerase